MRPISVSIGGKHNAKVLKTWTGSWERFCELMLKDVPETTAKDSVGWVCGAVFDPPYRDSENFVARNLLSFDYDHIAPADLEPILVSYRGFAHLAYTTWSHTADHPRIRVWIPLSRPCGYDEFQAVSRKLGARADIERMARESHVPAQYMFRAAVKPFEEFASWSSTDSPWVDVDQILGEYDDWTDRNSWPHRAEGDGVHSEGSSIDPRTKPGIIGAFCRGFTISEAIERFDLPYSRAGTEGRWTYLGGSRPEGAIVYDEDTKLHSHHDTDPARGQSNAYDLVRLHRFGAADKLAGDGPLAGRPSTKAMRALALSEPAVLAQLPAIRAEEEFVDLDSANGGDRASDERSGAASAGLPERINKASSKLTDQENARRIQRKFGDNIISIGKGFYYWKGTHWEKGEARVFRCVTKLSSIVHAEGQKIEGDLVAALPVGEDLTKEQYQEIRSVYGWARECGQKSKLTSCMDILRTLLDFDARNLNISPALFSCANGTLDLRSGEMRAHEPKDFITACSKIAYDENARAPRFEQFLAEIFDDPEVAAFVQRWFGYCLTGEVNEHKVVFHIGGGGNGKGTLMKLLRHVLGTGYYGTANQNLLTYEGKGASPELADLLGKRMVTISETEHAMELREGLLKQITGGDPISARQLFEGYFEFLPSHKLQIFTNHEPAIKTQDFAIWRRVILLKYPHSYGNAVQVASGEAERLEDPELENALLAEAPGVLRWLVEGARAWYARRLQAPESVIKATIAYRQQQDLPALFTAERLVVEAEAWAPVHGVAESIYSAYKGWCISMGLRHQLSRPRFEREMLRVVKGSSLETRRIDSALVPGFKGFRLAQSEIPD
jgi:P4 family phage/plasmid primase-like protien